MVRAMSDIWFMLSKADRYLYHYTRAETLTRFILPSKSLKLSSFHGLNDPRENKAFRINGGAWGDDLPPNVLDDFARLLKNDWRIACFVSDPPSAAFNSPDRLGAEQMQAMHDRGHSRPRMWAQYADNHKGACLVFDKAALATQFAELGARMGLEVLSGPVEYENVRVAPRLELGAFCADMNGVRRFGLEEASRRHARQFWRELFLTKNTDWSAEYEFRWLLNGKSEGDLFVPIGGTLRGVLVGSEFPEALEAPVRDCAGALDVKLARMDWSNGIPQIRIMIPRTTGKVGWA